MDNVQTAEVLQPSDGITDIVRILYQTGSDQQGHAQSCHDSQYNTEYKTHTLSCLSFASRLFVRERLSSMLFLSEMKCLIAMLQISTVPTIQ